MELSDRERQALAEFNKLRVKRQLVATPEALAELERHLASLEIELGL